MKTKQLIINAPKYVLFIKGAGYLANTQKLTGIIFTDRLELAQIFAVGFDSVESKTSIWDAEAKRYFNNPTNFEVINL